MQKIKIQIVEDESIFAMDLVSQLKSMHYSVISVTDTGEKAVQEADKKKPDLILMDIRLKDEMDGIEAAQQIRKRKNIPIIFITAYAEEKTLTRAKVAEPFGYLLKPINKRELRAVIEMALYKHRMEKKLLASEQRFRGLIKNIVDLLFVIDSHANIIDVNHTACKKSGYTRDEFFRLSVKDLFIGDQINIQEILHHLHNTGSMTIEHTLQCKNANTFPVEINIGLLSDEENPLLLALARDITSRKKSEAEKLELEKQLLHAQKLEELGRLAGGMAHDFNNILTVVQGYSELALMKTDRSSPLYADLREIRDAAYRSASLTRQLLLFSRRQPMDYSLININTLINNLMRMLNRLLGENIVIKKDLKRGLWDVWGDLGSIEQVIMNLVINAKDAIRKGGKITITTDNITINKSDIDNDTDEKPGNYVVVKVKDTGVGMDKQTLKRVFTPFFTTKETGEGTGLGLSVVNDIVKSNSGWVDVTSKVGRGSTFTVYFPASFKKDMKRTEKPSEDLQDLKGQGEHVLLVEDEDTVRDFASMVLRKNGYEVTVAATVKQALYEFNNKKNNFQLLFTDMVLPDGTGQELAKKIRNDNPKISVLLSSGYTFENIKKIKEEERYEFIQKPYSIVTILRGVKKSLDSGRR